MMPSVRKTLDNPFQAFRDIDRVLNRVWDSVEEGVGVTGFPVDIREDNDQLIVEAELPGYPKDSIDVSVEQGTLTIEAERQTASNGTSKHHVQERRSSRVARRFTLPKAYDTNEVDASYVDGILTLKLNKREESKPQKIQVK